MCFSEVRRFFLVWVDLQGTNKVNSFKKGKKGTKKKEIGDIKKTDRKFK